MNFSLKTIFFSNKQHNKISIMEITYCAFSMGILIAFSLVKFPMTFGYVNILDIVTLTLVLIYRKYWSNFLLFSCLLIGYLLSDLLSGFPIYIFPTLLSRALFLLITFYFKLHYLKPNPFKIHEITLLFLFMLLSQLTTLLIYFIWDLIFFQHFAFYNLIGNSVQIMLFLLFVSIILVNPIHLKVLNYLQFMSK